VVIRCAENLSHSDPLSRSVIDASGKTGHVQYHKDSQMGAATVVAFEGRRLKLEAGNVLQNCGDGSYIATAPK
jgi:hypothetical protein